eukprot:scaffold1138_cov128-Cylindrotheca_fusiformis.AAC.30
MESSNLTDEELATALQQQYRLDFLRRQEAKQRRSSRAVVATTPPENMQVEDDGSSDEAYARHLQQQLDREASSFANRAPHTSHSQSLASTPRGSNDDVALAMQLQDEELARQYSSRSANANTNHDVEHQMALSQEQADAEVAQQLAALEEEDAQRRQQRAKSIAWKRAIALFIIVAAITIALLFVFGVFSKDDGGFGRDWVDNDPWGAIRTVDGNIVVDDNAIRWPVRNNQGLTLSILNAMEDKYDNLLAEAVKNWDAGAPVDSLTLTLEKIDYDYDCKEKNGVMKACNGDYGDNGWRGLNEVKLNSVTKIIVSSTARMNDHYLKSSSVEQKLYTICHELGHGFGLPHWDIDFDNKDLGTCMDYTRRPGNNMYPSESNFQYLAELYGGRTVSASSAVDNASAKSGKANDGNRRILHTSDKEEVHYIEVPGEDMVILRHYHLN